MSMPRNWEQGRPEPTGPSKALLAAIRKGPVHLLKALAGAAERIELVERALTDTIVDLGSKGDSVGDLLTFANPVFDAANQIKLGTDRGYCVRVVPGKS